MNKAKKVSLRKRRIKERKRKDRRKAEAKAGGR